MYNQESKIKCRELIIGEAVKSLTKERQSSYVISENNFYKILLHFKGLFYQFIEKHEPSSIEGFEKHFNSTKKEWDKHFDNYNNNKKASALKVLYLSGPEPKNDIEEFLKHGILLSNIWAIESDKNTYEFALQNLIDTGYYIKLHKGTLKDFFEQTNHEFDIIYFDACSPIVSPKHDPVDTLKEIFLRKRLTPLSALITNFAEPKENYNWGDILAPWFATRHEKEMPKIDYKCKLEFDEKSLYLKDYSEYIEKYKDDYYDNFIVHFISTLASEIIPLNQVVSIPSVQNKYFMEYENLNKLFTEIKNNKESEDNLESFLKTVSHFKLAVQAYPLLNWVRLSKEILPENHSLIRFINSKNNKSSLELSMYIGTLIKSYEESRSGFNTYADKVCSSLFKQIITELDYFDRTIRLTCDTPMKNLIIEFLFGIYGFPYIANTNKVQSYKYIAKETWMYSNVFIFDQCRCLYDFVPSIEVFSDFFKSIPNQMIIRSGIDCIYRNHNRLNSNIFEYGLIESIDRKFGWFDLKKREIIN
jgi:hypothetical protein